MISILIPTYNFDICDLVLDLQQQCEKIDLPFEILCFDDLSEKNFQVRNRKVQTWKNVVYKELSEKHGRSKIRNVLADAAQYEYLLFMDCDSKVVKTDFIQAYLAGIQPNLVLYGGRVYQAKSPQLSTLFLHWYYGKKREEASKVERERSPYHSFMTNNFLIPKAIFQKIRFNETLTQYGHEDTLFGLALQQNDIPIQHLDNPLEHLGLETAQVFLDKSQKAIENLYFLYKQNQVIETKLLQYVKQLKKWKIDKLVGKLLVFGKPLFLYNLKSSAPALVSFDCYKLCLFLEQDVKSTLYEK